MPLTGAVRIGSDRRQNDVVLDLPSVEPFHAEVVAGPVGWELVSLGMRKLKVDDGMSLHARLDAGSEFTIGPVAFRVEAVEAAPRASSGSGRAVAPPERHTHWSVLLGLALAAATLALTWSARRDPSPAKSGAPPRTARADPTAPKRPRPKAADPVRLPPLEAGSVALAPAADDARTPQDASVTILVRLGGSPVPIRGFFVSAGGQLVTNHHLVAGTGPLEALVPGAGAPVPARLVAFDAARDLALLQAAVPGPVVVASLDDEAEMRGLALALGVSAADLRSFVAANR